MSYLRRRSALGAADPCIGTPGYDPTLAAQAKTAMAAGQSAAADLGAVQDQIASTQAAITATQATIKALSAQKATLSTPIATGLGAALSCADQNTYQRQIIARYAGGDDSAARNTAAIPALKAQLVTLQAQLADLKSQAAALQAWIDANKDPIARFVNQAQAGQTSAQVAAAQAQAAALAAMQAGPFANLPIVPIAIAGAAILFVLLRR